ncbi:carbohydrate binding family 9 domain-containing protein [Henriciella aquimarina]|uniref:carbohydrate binding family 9 domain-containing protein n=1 Tax=Henriciella aquimarina TaxID=545261 RepID=UPI000A033F6C|nr:carbohydrate binding family 9 domain-containing protein [Henriciella aquimarina]
MCVWPVAAQDEPQERDFQTYTPSVSPVRIERSEAPVIDGKLDDAAWDKAAVLTEFYQVEPEITAPDVKTRVYLAYDEDNLYVAVYAFDDEIDDIFATILERDGEVWRDDMLRFYIDPFDTGISGFGFDVNALGARAERLVQANRGPVDEWDTIWDSAGQILEDGWSAELVIPFRSLSFDPGGDGWGLMVTRERSHKSQEIRWAAIDQSVSKFGFSRAGRLEGITDINRGIGLDVQVQAGLNANRDWTSPRDDDVRLEPSANIAYKITPSMTGLLTLNTDFSDTPLDARQINTGRFSLFFPETRDFFLQDAAFFEFGGQTFTNGSQSIRATSNVPNGQPFFSRRIGIVNGQSVKIRGGLKLSGEAGGFEIGALTAQTGEALGIDSQNLSVARIATDLGRQHRVGMIATHGDPTGRTDNTVVGVDYLFQTPSFLGGSRMQTDVYYLRSSSSTQGDDDSFGFRTDYQGDALGGGIEFRQIGDDFAPALGFVNRAGTRTYSAAINRRLRQGPDWMRWWQFGTRHEYITDLDGRMETRRNDFVGGIQTRWTDDITLTLSDEEQVIRTPFTLPGGLVVPEGSYGNDGITLRFQSSFTRPYGTTLEVSHQDFYGGESTLFSGDFLFRPNARIDLRASYSVEEISVPAGEVDVQISSINTVFNLTPNLSISSQTQYDNISHSLSFFTRLNWEARPETELFLALGHGAIIEDDDFRNSFRSIQTSAIIRLGNTFRF